MKNEYGVPLDRNGYAESVIQQDKTKCFLCGRRNDKLDRHEPFGGALREKSQRLGIWVCLCHSGCHQGPDGVHSNAEKAKKLKRQAQEIAMEYYGWSLDDWHREFGKNYLDI